MLMLGQRTSSLRLELWLLSWAALLSWLAKVVCRLDIENCLLLTFSHWDLLLLFQEGLPRRMSKALVLDALLQDCRTICFLEVLGLAVLAQLWITCLSVREFLRASPLLTSEFTLQAKAVAVWVTVIGSRFLLSLHHFCASLIISGEIVWDDELSGCLNDGLPLGPIWDHLLELLGSLGVLLKVLCLDWRLHKMNLLKHSNILIDLPHQVVLPLHKVEWPVHRWAVGIHSLGSVGELFISAVFHACRCSVDLFCCRVETDAACFALLAHHRDICFSFVPVPFACNAAGASCSLGFGKQIWFIHRRLILLLEHTVVLKRISGFMVANWAHSTSLTFFFELFFNSYLPLVFLGSAAIYLILSTFLDALEQVWPSQIVYAGFDGVDAWVVERAPALAPAGTAPVDPGRRTQELFAILLSRSWTNECIATGTTS